ncbi:MAG: sterol desaturase family protein [Cytophagales bacterium]|nr:sterol desaturase family protein [Cytophagales bacterium]
MARLFVSNKDESVRMFKNDIMDKISRIHFAVPLYIYVPIMAICLYRALFVHYTHPLYIILFIIIGIVLWTFTEYNLHRFVFHHEPKSEWGKRIHFITHGVHHDYPNDSMRLVMVPSISMPLCVFFYALFYIILGSKYVDSFFIGYVAGYLFYDMTHYALHHANFKSKFWIDLKKHHMHHHYMEPDRGFGVSTMFWDLVYKSTFRKKNASHEN